MTTTTTTTPPVAPGPDPGGGGGSGGLRVAVVGAGIAGLATAAFLRAVPRVGVVTLYERRPTAAAARIEPSAALGLWDDGVAALRDGLGLAAADLGPAVVGVGARTLDKAGHEVGRARAPGGLVWLLYRADLRDALERCALGSGAGAGAGTSPPPPATEEEGSTEAKVSIEYGKKAVRVDAENGIVWFEDGTRVQADLVVGADGIRSTVREAVAPAHPAPEPCGLSMYRFVVPAAEVRAALGAAASTLYDATAGEDEDGGGVYISILAAGDAGNRNIVTYPCRGGALINFACAAPDGAIRGRAGGGGSGDGYSWTARGDPAEMAALFADFAVPGLAGLLRRVPACDLFRLHDQAPLASYAAGRAVLVGDAAHPMVPYKAQGANQALLDAAALRCAFAAGDAAAVRPVPDALRAWDAERRPRATELQRASRVSQQKLSSREGSEVVCGKGVS